jgi:GDPmannose 4,6-dehydratase
MIKKVIVTGVLGQDGANMVEYLLKETDYEIFGVMRRTSNPNFSNCNSFIKNQRFNLVYADLGDNVSIEELIIKIQPDYFINFAAQSFVGCSWTIPTQTFDTNATGVLRCLEAIRRHKPDCRFYSAGSSEEFGDVDYSPQGISHPIKPRSPYGASKAAARHLVKVYRESYKLFAVHGILFNHEGTKRGEEFVTRKITKGVARIASALRKKETFAPLELGNLDAKRDWSDSEDFVDGVWKMLNQDSPKDYVLSSGETHSIREFVELSFRYAGVVGIWNGKGLQEQFSISTEDHFKFDAQSSVLMKVNPEFYRPAEVEILLGDSNPAKEELGWQPEVSFPLLVKKMTKNDIELLTKRVS